MEQEKVVAEQEVVTCQVLLDQGTAVQGVGLVFTENSSFLFRKITHIKKMVKIRSSCLG